MTTAQNKPKLVCIDGDLISFKASAVNTERYVECTHKETAELLEFKTLTKFREWAGDTKDEYEVVAKQKAGPLRNAFHVVNHMINNIVEACGAESYHIVISGDDNFRDDLPLPSKYKGSREGGMRPPQLKDCKEYLIQNHNAEVSDGVEADDVLVAYMVAGSIQASTDKDALHGPGWLYNWDTMEAPEYITGYGELKLIEKVKADNKVEKSIKGRGRAWLYFQMVFGDAVDCYKPCELAKVKFGEIGAYNLLKGCKTDKEALQAVAKQYQSWYPESITYRDWNGVLHTKDWLEIWQMYADAAFMRRWDGDRFDVKKVLTKQGIINEEA